MRNLRRSGANEQVAMSISGHKTSATFRRYDIVCNDDKVAALAALAKAQARARKARAAKVAGEHKVSIVEGANSQRVQ